MIYSFARYRSFTTDNDYFEMVRPVLRASLILVYCLSGFHKLNTDFLNPQVSCAGVMLSRVVELGSIITPHLGISVDLVLAIVLATAVFTILWELIGGLLLAIPKFQAPMLLVLGLCTLYWP